MGTGVGRAIGCHELLLKLGLNDSGALADARRSYYRAERDEHSRNKNIADSAASELINRLARSELPSFVRKAQAAFTLPECEYNAAEAAKRAALRTLHQALGVRLQLDKEGSGS